MNNINTQENISAPSAVNPSVIDAVIMASNLENEIHDTVNVPDSVDVATLDAIKAKSNKCLVLSKEQKYQAIGYAYIWYHAAKSNAKYLDKAFKTYSGRSPNAHYLNTVKFCFNFSENEQGSTLTKYAKVMKFIEDKLGCEIDMDATDAFVDQVVTAITSNGGLDKTAANILLYTTRPPTANCQVSKKGTSSTAGSKTKSKAVKQVTAPTLVANEADKATEIDSASTDKAPVNDIDSTNDASNNDCVSADAENTFSITQKSNESIGTRGYLKCQPLASFAFPNDLIPVLESELVVMVGVVSGDQINVVKVVSDDHWINNLIGIEVAQE